MRQADDARVIIYILQRSLSFRKTYIIKSVCAQFCVSVNFRLSIKYYPQKFEIYVGTLFNLEIASILDVLSNEVNNSYLKMLNIMYYIGLLLNITAFININCSKVEYKSNGE